MGLRRHSESSTTASIGFSDILADEYALIVPFATHLQFGLTNHGISAQQKALTLHAIFSATVLTLNWLMLNTRS